ncbi:MAG: NosD domain-containing protein, partial [Thermoplasmatota archaeon]
GSGYGYCIYIGNTTDHLVIKDCYLHDASGNNGYYFKNSGLYFQNVSNATADNITASGNDYGIYSDWSGGNLFLENNLSGNNFGAEFHRSESNELKNNNISDNDYGIYLSYSNSNILKKSNISYNKYGINLGNCGDNRIIRNRISLNTEQGIHLWNTRSNTIHHNHLLRNEIHARSNYYNELNASYPVGGNFWDNYTGIDIYSGPDQDQPGSDGIGDTPYAEITGGSGSRDIYPLMFPPDMDPPRAAPTPADGKVDQTAFEPYVLSFSKAMNTTLYPVVEPAPPAGSWAWDTTGMWCNFSGPTQDLHLLWESGTKYRVDVTHLVDTDGISLTGDTRFNFTIDGDPPVVYDVSGEPMDHVSVNNPIIIDAKIRESAMLMMGVVLFLVDAGGNTTLDNYTAIEQVEGDLNPTAEQDIFDLTASWNATSGLGPDSTAGYLTDGIDQDHLKVNRWWDDPTGEWNMGLDVYFSNDTLTKQSAKLQFRADGSSKGLWIDEPISQWVTPLQFDDTMSVVPRVEIISFHRFGGLASDPGVSNYGEYGHTYDLIDVSFVTEPAVLTRDHSCVVVAMDGGGNIGYHMLDTNVSVDNTPPSVITTPADGATNVSTDAGEYTILFSEPVNTSIAEIWSDLPGDTWTWSSDGSCVTGRYDPLEGAKEYFVDILHVKDLAGNELPADEEQRNFTTGAPWAVMTGPVSEGTNNNTPTLTYDHGNNATEVIIYLTTDGGETWDPVFWDKPADGIVILEEGIGWSGTYHWSARAKGAQGGSEDDEPVPSGPGDIEGGGYVLDMDRPFINSTIPENWANMVSRSAGTYVIEFSEPMNTSQGVVDSNLPDVSWEWDGTGRWLNGTYGELEKETRYHANLSGGGFVDLVGNELIAEFDLQFHTERGPWARVNNEPSKGSFDTRPWIWYSVSNSTFSVEIYYTDDGGVSWTLWGTDDNANGSWVPDSDLSAPGTYSWNARAIGYINEPVPDGADFMESGEYVLLDGGENVEIRSTRPHDEESGVGLNPDIYVMEFEVAMQRSKTPDSNLPDVSWSWSGDGRWLNGSYGGLDASNTYHVDLEQCGFRSAEGIPLSGDMYRTFTTRSEDETATGTVKGRVTDENGDPIYGAKVAVIGTEITTTTDGDGHYVLEDVPVGERTIRITHPDHEDLEFNVDLEEGEIDDRGTDQLSWKEEKGSLLWLLIIALIVMLVIVSVVLILKRGSGKGPVTEE